MSNPKILNNVRLIQKCIIVREDGKVLGLRRAIDDHSRGGNWDLPGGGYEQGEEVIGAIAREVMEEAGLTVHSVKPIYFTNKLGVKVGFFQGDNVFATTYVCDDWEGLPAEASAKAGEVTLSNEHIESQWFTPQEFLELNFGPDDGYFADSMRAYLNSISHS